MVELLTDTARELISYYCVNECTAECCKSGRSLNVKGEKIRLNPCKYLKEDRCGIHSERPTVCRNYPIRVDKLGDRKIVIINECKAVKDGLIDDIGLYQC